MKNRIEVEGYIAAAPERRFCGGGAIVANARLGETYGIKRGDGYEPHTNWFALSFYGDLATAAATLKKGSHVHVTGWMEHREWTAADGKKRSTWELNVGQFHEIAPRAKTAAGAADASQ
jgi:single stranded DNA-binding protein